MAAIIRVPVAATRGLGSRMPDVTRSQGRFKTRTPAIARPRRVIAVTRRGAGIAPSKAVA